MLHTIVLYLIEVQELRLQTTIPITTVDQIQITNKTRSKITVLQEEKVVAPLDLIRLAQVIQTAHLDPIRLVQVILVIQDQVMVEEDLQEVEEEREVKIIQKHLYQ